MAGEAGTGRYSGWSSVEAMGRGRPRAEREVAGKPPNLFDDSPGSGGHFVSRTLTVARTRPRSRSTGVYLTPIRGPRPVASAVRPCSRAAAWASSDGGGESLGQAAAKLAVIVPMS